MSKKLEKEIEQLRAENEMLKNKLPQIVKVEPESAYRRDVIDAVDIHIPVGNATMKVRMLIQEQGPKEAKETVLRFDSKPLHLFNHSGLLEFFSGLPKQETIKVGEDAFKNAMIVKGVSYDQSKGQRPGRRTEVKSKAGAVQW